MLQDRHTFMRSLRAKNAGLFLRLLLVIFSYLFKCQFFDVHVSGKFLFYSGKGTSSVGDFHAQRK